MKTPHEIYIEALEKISRDMKDLGTRLEETLVEIETKRALLEKLKEVYNE
jgi:hypothetical protein